MKTPQKVIHRTQKLIKKLDTKYNPKKVFHLSKSNQVTDKSKCLCLCAGI